MRTFGSLLRQFRVAAALSQEALAERCRISPDTIAALERGRRLAPRLATVRVIADALELAPADRVLLAEAAGSSNAAASQDDGVPADDDAIGAAPLTQRPALATKDRPGGPLPTPLTPLFGRQAESDALAQALASERLVTLVGPGGVGKTRLALLLANKVLDKFAGGTWWVELGSVGDPEKVPEAVLRALGASEQPGASIGEQALASLTEEPVLFIFDNCEHVLEAVATLVGELLAHASLTVVATSREPLGIPGELRWPVSALAVPDRGAALAELVDIDSVQLFVERATRAYPHFVLTDANTEAAARICRRLEGIPLAIELAAARAGVQALGDLAAELEERIPLTAATARGVPSRQSTLLACVDWSYRLLDDHERKALRCLAGFPGSFSAEAFAAVMRRLAPSGPRSAEATLSQLTEKSLVIVDPQLGRYRALETIRVFAADRADEASELEPIYDAHAEWLSRWLAELEALNASDSVLDRIETEYANIRAALVRSIERRSPRAAAIVADLGVAWHQQNRFQDARVLGDGALAVATETDRAAWARAVAALGQARLLSGDAAFRATLIEAETVARQRQDQVTEGRCRFTQGYGAPFDGTALVAAYELALGASAPLLAGAAAAALASGGADEQRDAWLQRADGVVGVLDNSTIKANYDLAMADSLMERGRMQEALDLAVASAFDTRVMPTTRLLGIGRVLQVAMYRTDLGAQELISQMTEDLAHVWPVGGSWQSSSWTVFGSLLRLWSALLRGESASAMAPEDLQRLTRMAVTPSVVRFVCRAALQGGQRPDALAAAHGVAPPTAGSLMAASIASIEAAQAAVDGDGELAGQRWRTTLAAAAANDWRLLVCDSLEGLGCLASRDTDASLTTKLLVAARRCRHEIGYLYRFRFEQDQVARTWATLGGDSMALPSLTWQAAADLALST